MCIHGSSPLKEFPPGAGDPPPPSMTSKATEAAASTASTASTAPSKKVHSYQNVTCNADTKLFQLEEKKAEATTSEAVAKLQAASEAVSGVKKESPKKDMVSLQLSGGCLINNSSAAPIMIIHHHHHHFYPNQNVTEVNSNPVSITFVYNFSLTVW